MKKIRLLQCFLLLSVFFLCFSQKTYAERVSHASRELSKEGIKHYKEGDFSSALHELSKAVMTDPRNEEAQEYLQKMGFEEGIYGYDRTPSEKITDLARKNYISHNKVIELEHSNAEKDIINHQLKGQTEALHFEVQERDDEISHLHIKAHLVKNEFNKQTALDKKKIGELNAHSRAQEQQIELYDRIADRHVKVIDDREAVIEDKKGEIDFLQKEVQFVKNDMIDEIIDYETRLTAKERRYDTNLSGLRKKMKYYKSTLGKENKVQHEKIGKLSGAVRTQGRQITGLKDTILVQDLELARKDKMLYSSERAVDRLAYLRSQAQTPEDITDMFVGSQGQVITKSELIKQRDQDVARLKEKLTAALNHIAALEKIAQKKEGAQIQNLKNQLASMQRQLSETDGVLNEKTSDIQLLEERFADAQQRLSFVQRIIEEKDDRINELQNEIIQLKNRLKEK